jgi:cell shape-determining protein MreD
MREQNLKAVIALVILFLLDLIKPFSYSLYVEFIFLGIIFISLNYPLYFALVVSIIFGYLKDSLSYDVIAFNIIEFPFISLFTHYLLHHFQKKLTKVFIFLSILIIHIAINGIYMETISYFFSLTFFAQSCIVFLLINYLLKRWLSPLSAESFLAA